MSLSMLRCDGERIFNAEGKQVFLRGTNLGGWLLDELWMGFFKGGEAQWDIVTALKNRFGKDEADRLIKLREDNYITEYDLDYLQSLGFTCVRVPFWYRNFQLDDNGTWIRKENGEIDFSRLDWVVEKCGKRGMNVILDMHGVPGHQSIAQHSCRVNHCKLYDETQEGEHIRALACEMWSEIAEHFAGNGTVAAYDLMNEPMCDYEDEDKVNSKYHDVYSLLYDAVRAKDPDHIITLEGIWTPDDLPYPSERGWENVMYQYHLYDDSNESYKDVTLHHASRNFNVPVLAGEFAPCRGTATWDYILKLFNECGYHWQTWTYKGHCPKGETTQWFMMGSDNEDLVVDINNDSAEEIERKWSSVRTENCCKPMNNHALLSEYAKP